MVTALLTITISSPLFVAILIAVAAAGFITGGYVHSRTIQHAATEAKKDAIDFAEYVRGHDEFMLHMPPDEVMMNDKTIVELYDEYLFA